ncbi:DUF655 domain-containing protein [Bosea sp. BIWAKO-01]|uniref:ComEA family DNA-binding protein n=1 Tax=Bosea sp. BIWAKO-01 TaxID=506668 RepID=UPI000853356A|nr:DUF655 domain-containing protein [Bosea sp. BIWAKO-01]GAU83894.1 hypothetical protein BIWAKO_03822 [Bosea sp. BIWAKO-01]
MSLSRIISPIVALALTAGFAFAQQPATQPSAPARAPAPVATPAAPAAGTAAKPAQPAAAAQVKKININTATAAELDSLKGIGEARSKKIIEERSKAKFKDFNDLVKRSVLPSNVESDIKDKITF